MRIATWNVGGLKAWPEHVVRWLDKNQPDVIGLQEARTRDIESAVLAFSAQGYSCRLHLETDEEGFVPGVAILSRHPLEVTQEGLPGQGRLVVHNCVCADRNLGQGTGLRGRCDQAEARLAGQSASSPREAAKRPSRRPLRRLQRHSRTLGHLAALAPTACG